MYKEDLALNNLQWLICHKSKSKPFNSNYAYRHKKMGSSIPVQVLDEVIGVLTRRKYSSHNLPYNK